ncbi:ATP-binding protein [Methylibium sp. T29]|uniref:sensor histidine kinase n=1 Tax=Methylibium sp. T29 TaxID=1430884 RepID=UPI0003F3DE90|nr:ATP-binding protein [Methylibium sp. T29]EWS55993.1 Sensor histidine kinase LiaS [Methylibium sp. T29]
MDLSKRLVVWLALLAALWLGITLVYTAVALRSGIQDEMQGANAVVELLSTAAEANLGDAHSQLRLQALLAEGHARHLRVRWADEPSQDNLEQVSLLHDYARRLAPAGKPVAQHRIAIGPRTLIVEPAPDSEIDEVLGDVLPLLLLLLVAGGAMLFGVWWIVRQALAPASVLCAGLARLQAGQPEPGFPALRLREYAAIARGIDELAAGLATARCEQSRLTQRLIDVQERERRRLASDLHDEFGQHLTAMSATASLLQRHAARLDPVELARCADQMVASLGCIRLQLRTLLSRLRPHGLEAEGLAHELAGLIDRARAHHPTVTIRADIAVPLPALPEDAALALYRSLQEALTNAYRHSGAGEVQVRIDVPAVQRVRMRVIDDGCGRASALPRGGLGLLGMRERLAMVGGGLRLVDNAGPGLCVEVWVPVPAVAVTESLEGEMLDTRLAA